MENTPGFQADSESENSDRNENLPQDQEKHESDDFDSSSSSDSSVAHRKHNNAAFITESDSTSSESDWDETPTKKKCSNVPQPDEDSSSESDGQSDKCPICLLKFKGQEIGSPDSCDHAFCYDCILEWSKNVTTCPIDRQQFQLILVKKHLDGCIIRQTPVQSQQQEDGNIIVEDATFCEICGSSDREDRMLLCDGCDLGYHLECLTPPLEHVPNGTWLCPECGPEDLQQDISIYELEVLYNDAAEIGAPAHPRRIIQSNVIPRTRQSDRIRAQIISNRRVAASLEVEDNVQLRIDQPSTSRSTQARRAPKRKKYRKTTRKRKPRIWITCEIGKREGQEIVIKTDSKHAIEKRKLKRKRKQKSRAAYKKKKRSRIRLAKAIAENKTTKRRLAKQIGICPPRTSGQILPDMRITNDTPNLNYLRGQAGIPSLSLFGNRDELNYFSGSDAEDDGDGGYETGVLVRRRPNLSDITIFRSAASRKAFLLPQAPTTSNCDILSSIMDSQEKMHSKNAVMSVNKDGTLKIDSNKNVKHEQNRNSIINVNDTSQIRTRNAPMYSNDNPGNGSSQEYRGNDNRAAAISSGTISNNSVSTSGCDANGGSSSKSESELDIYSDIETVSTSKVEEDSDKGEEALETVKVEEKSDKIEEPLEALKKDAQEEDVSSTTNVLLHSDRSDENTDDEECPNFSIYSKDTINLVANRNPEQDEVGSSLDINNRTPVKDETSLPPPHMKDEDVEDDVNLVQAEHSEDDIVEKQLVEAETEETMIPEMESQTKPTKKKVDFGLYSDSDEEVAKTTDASKPFGIGDIRSLTEDISEEERSYTPCLDERVPLREGFEGLGTEAISEDEKNDFDESQELKTVSDGGDALEINAKESELDFTKPEDYEEGEIVDKLKKIEDAKAVEAAPAEEMEKQEEATVEAPTFKRISKSTKDRNYRDKERDRSRSRSYSKEKNKENEREKKRERKKEKRKELERYNVRNVVAEKPRKPPKDKFGRDARRRSTSRSSRSPSYSPQYRSSSRGRRSFSRPRHRNKRRVHSRGGTTSHSRSRSRRHSHSRRRRSLTRSVKRRSMRSLDRGKTKKNKSPSRHRTRSATPRRHRDWEAQQRSRAWSPSLSRSRTPERHISPSWTPPRALDNSNSNVKSHNLTVILTNDKKKKDKRKGDKRKKESAMEKSKKRKRDKTPLPSKEVFASGDNILVSVSFNKEAEEMSKRSKQRNDEVTTKRTRKEKEKRRGDVGTPSQAQSQKSKKKKQQQDLTGVKPVAIIDLDRSPFKELTPSPKDVIVLSDSDHSPEKVIITCDSSQQALDYALGPKTPPEPQVKFSLQSKMPQLRQITNPLHEPDDENEENEDIDPQDELEQRLNEAMHKGPNTPSDPPNSPPSSPDAYDPFDPTKSRSPTPDNTTTQSTSVQKPVDLSEDNIDIHNIQDKIPLSKTPEVPKSHTPPLVLVLADIQPADSQSNVNINNNTPDESSDKSSTQIATIPPHQGNSPIFPTKIKSVTPAIVYSSVTSTPTSSVTTTPRINILNSTIITPVLAAPQPPQRVLLPNIAKTSPMKASPTKAAVKMMPVTSKRPPSTSKLPKSATKNNRSTDSNDSNMDLDSPYSPGPSDFEDLFEPPIEHKSKAPSKPKASGKVQSSFDVLFGSPINKYKNSNKNDKGPKKGANSYGKCKQVKVDEDSLKILDDLPNSAVEMQVKDKFLKKLNRQERVVEEVKLVLKPHYNKKHINKEEYKDILRRAVPKICHNKSGEINPKKIQNLIEAYVKKFRHSKKVSSSSSVSLLK